MSARRSLIASAPDAASATPALNAKPTIAAEPLPVILIASSALRSILRRGALRRFRAANRAEDRLRSRGHIDISDPVGAPERVGDGVDDRWGRADRSGLARALETHRIGGRRNVARLESDRREIVGPRHAIVHEARGQELSVAVKNRALHQRLADRLGDAAVDLPLEQERVEG